MHIAYRNHPFRSQRKACNHNLLKEITLKNSKKYYPLKTYCYHLIIDSLKAILSRPTYIDQCERWRSRKAPEGMLCDIYDGQVWQDFLKHKDKPFLSQPHNIAFMLNCDWFQPYDHSQYSVGVLYLTILNLPRSIRFKPENIIVAGIIPGPNEPKKNTINSYLRPVVKELNSLWIDGFTMRHNSTSITVHAALLASVCDIPATCKIGGFLGHNSLHPCWKCSKEFKHDKELKRTDFSSATVGPSRTHLEHKKNAVETLSARTPTEKSKLECDKGRFTELMLLPYYDCICCTIIDPMHNLFLGTAKRIMHTQWLKNDLISKADLNIIQDRINAFCIPTNVGKIKHKISSEFSNLNANEWKNWTLLFSLPSLYDILPEDHLTCWHYFVSACNIYCSATVSLADIDKAHDFMQRFFKAAESLYGRSFLTLNTHLHLHLNQCLKDFGPCYGYWLFSFERYNGLLGQYQTNQRAIEIQLMQKFVSDMHIKSLVNQTRLTLEQKSLFNTFIEVKSSSAFTETIYGQGLSFLNNFNINYILSLSSANLSCSLNFVDDCPIKLIHPYKICKFDSDSLRYLQKSYQAFLPDVDDSEPLQLYCKHHIAEWWGMRLIKRDYQESKTIYFLAYWIGSDGNISYHSTNLSAGLIDFFFSQQLLIGSKLKEVIMIKVRWLQNHPEKNALKEPIQLWCSNLFKPFRPASFMPLMRLYEICAGCKIDFKGEHVLAINPIRKKVFY